MGERLVLFADDGGVAKEDWYSKMHPTLDSQKEN